MISNDGTEWQPPLVIWKQPPNAIRSAADSRCSRLFNLRREQQRLNALFINTFRVRRPLRGQQVREQVCHRQGFPS